MIHVQEHGFDDTANMYTEFLQNEPDKACSKKL